MRYHALRAAALTLAVLTAGSNAQQKQAIERADQLPAYSYAITQAPSALLQDEKGLAALMRSLRADLESDLARYDIRDSAALRLYYRTLSRIAFLEHRLDDALDYENRAAALEDKPAARMLSGVMFRPLIAAEKAEAGESAHAFSTSLAAELAQLPYDSVRADLNEVRGALQKQSAAFLEAAVANGIDPTARTGSITKHQAMQLLGYKFGLRRVPYYDEMVRQLSALDAAHVKPEPTDIWGARDVSLERRPGLTPIVVAVWDSGVDTAVFPGRVWTNVKEVPGNGKDDDANGYVDDAHGIAWTWDGKSQVGDLPPVELSPEDIAKAKQFQAGPQEAKRLFASLPKEEAMRLAERIKFYDQHYAHGTHVAGIAVRGNPAARLLVVRLDWPTRRVAPPATAAWAVAFARAISRSVEYYQNAGVRVVNMSWYVSLGEFEETLDINAVGATQQERHQLAMQSFDTVKSRFRAAIAAAPEILFVCGAGNSNNSNQFNDFVPASFDLPNTITVGAVGEAGDETRFTTLGKVDLYANGFEVESVVPGGDKLRMSGTSMASPQVVNLAAKLLAVHPELTTAALKRLIIDGADTKGISNGRSIRLLNEARSFELAGTLR